MEEVNELTKINVYFLDIIKHIVELEAELVHNVGDIEILKTAKYYGYSDHTIGRLWDMDEDEVRSLRHENKILPVYKMVDTCAAEFESHTPYFYSSYDEENESIKSDKPSVLVIGSGPIRIGQGVEFDYATVHSVKAIQKAGYEAIVMNSNPETVSTDFSISDKLYFEPLTLEDVLNVIELEQPLGVIVQFGGQTAINLAAGLEAHGVKVLGTTVEDLDRAEDRELFDQVINNLGLKQPIGKTATTQEQVMECAHEIGYPVLVRPSYVLGGRAMEIVNNDAELEEYLSHNAKAEIDHPILVDAYLEGYECEVDAICDGKDVLLPGIMEHIERAGVHSGDSMAVYPPQALSAEIKQTIEDYTIRLARGLNCIGMMNIQFVIHDNQVYVIEVNPRASRTVPFLSKVTGIPMAQIATKAILGEKLSDLGFTNGLYPESNAVHVKAPVFSFTKLQQVDTYLGPEMKSTGEVMGSDQNLDKALYKAFEASGLRLPDYGAVLFTIADETKEEALALAKRFSEIGYSLLATKHTAAYFEKNGLIVTPVAKISEKATEKNVVELIREGKAQVVVNTIDKDRGNASKDGFIIRREVEHGIPLFTSLDTADAIIRVMESRAFSTQAI